MRLSLDLVHSKVASLGEGGQEAANLFASEAQVLGKLVRPEPAVDICVAGWGGPFVVFISWWA